MDTKYNSVHICAADPSLVRAKDNGRTEKLRKRVLGDDTFELERRK